MRYAIFEGNMERLTKKMTRIGNKCRKFGCDFRFEEVGEEFRDVLDENGQTVKARFILVEAEGIARVNGWKFIASVEHTKKGNIINRAVDVEVPERYYTCGPECEHCRSNRMRKDTFIVMNEETGEFKQVGRNCLCDFTHGMSAEAVSQYMSAFEDLIEGETPLPGSNFEYYYDTEEYLRYAAETIRHFGYVKSDSGYCTRERALDYYLADHNGFTGMFAYLGKKYRQQMEDVGFDARRPETVAQTAAALAWIDRQPENSNYIHNLKVACALEYVTGKNLGILTSLFAAHNRDLEKEAKRRLRKENDRKSEWVGSVGQRIELKPIEVVCLTGWETQWGYTCIYKITDETGNVYTWKTGKDIGENVKKIKGTVKAHNEYRGTKQTELTRCACA